MSKIQAVIGANYGDEGKGFTTDYLCSEALKAHQSCIVILSNGGAQRGHTVETEDGARFVFHHLGAGSLLGVGSFFCRDYILNPMMFKKDWQALLDLMMHKANIRLPHLYGDPDCRFSTPYDMMANQIFEDARGGKRHGSVCIGIWETVRRYEKGFGLPIQEFMSLSAAQQYDHLLCVRDYMTQRIKDKLGYPPTAHSAWKDIWKSDTLIWHFLSDCRDMMQLVRFSSIENLAQYDILVVENAQGVLLGQSRYDGTDYTTPSDTGALEIKRLLDAGLQTYVRDTELYYVSRTYITKHGAGTFCEECPKEALNPTICDLTNQPNPYQGTLRYGRLNPSALARHIREDLQDMEPYPYKVHLMLTHADEYPCDAILNPLCSAFSDMPLQFHIAFGRTRRSVKSL